MNESENSNKVQDGSACENCGATGFIQDPDYPSAYMCEVCDGNGYKIATLAQPSTVPVGNLQLARTLFEEMALIADDEKCIHMLAGALAQPSPCKSQVAEALRVADWSNTCIGNKALILAAIEQLEAQPSPAPELERPVDYGFCDGVCDD